VSIICVRATFECDGCGGQFRIEMDPASMRPKGWSLTEEAEDFLRGMCGADGGMPAMVHDMHLCDDCAGVAASCGPDDQEGYSSKEVIQEALARTPRKPKRRSASPQEATHD
jgi:hypothetical protein